MKVVVNATPLIALSLIDRLNLLQRLFSDVWTPQRVYDEVVGEGATLPGAAALVEADWIQVQSPQTQTTIEPILLGLDAGEMDALLLAREIKADWVIMDERLGRRVAQALDLSVKGTLGILLAATRANLMTEHEALTAARRLADEGIHISARLMEWLGTELNRP